MYHAARLTEYDNRNFLIRISGDRDDMQQDRWKWWYSPTVYYVELFPFWNQLKFLSFRNLGSNKFLQILFTKYLQQKRKVIDGHFLFLFWFRQKIYTKPLGPWIWNQKEFPENRTAALSLFWAARGSMQQRSALSDCLIIWSEEIPQARNRRGKHIQSYFNPTTPSRHWNQRKTPFSVQDEALLDAGGARLSNR